MNKHCFAYLTYLVNTGKNYIFSEKTYFFACESWFILNLLVNNWIFFYLCLGTGLWCFWPTFDTCSIFCFVTLSLITQKIKIFQCFRFFWKSKHMTHPNGLRWFNIHYCTQWLPPTLLFCFWRHWCAHFFTSCRMRSLHKIYWHQYSNSMQKSYSILLIMILSTLNINPLE